MKPAASDARSLASEGARSARPRSACGASQRTTRWTERDRARQRGRRCPSNRCRPPLLFRKRSKKFSTQEGPRDAQQRARWTRGRNTRWTHGQRTSLRPLRDEASRSGQSVRLAYEWCAAGRAIALAQRVDRSALGWWFIRGTVAGRASTPVMVVNNASPVRPGERSGRSATLRRAKAGGLSSGRASNGCSCRATRDLSSGRASSGRRCCASRGRGGARAQRVSADMGRMMAAFRERGSKSPHAQSRNAASQSTRFVTVNSAGSRSSGPGRRARASRRARPARLASLAASRTRDRRARR